MKKQKLITIKCPNCNSMIGNTTETQGNVTIRCKTCGTYVKYLWRKKETIRTTRPERNTSSGTILY